MRRSSVIGWVVLAIAGLAVAAGVSLAASQLSSQRIGLASEPLSAGERLAPAVTTTTPSVRTTTTPSTTPTTTPSTTRTEPDDDRGQGRGRGDGDNDADD